MGLLRFRSRGFLERCFCRTSRKESRVPIPLGFFAHSGSLGSTLNHKNLIKHNVRVWDFAVYPKLAALNNQRTTLWNTRSNIEGSLL